MRTMDSQELGDVAGGARFGWLIGSTIGYAFGVAMGGGPITGTASGMRCAITVGQAVSDLEDWVDGRD